MNEALIHLRRIRPNVHWIRLRKLYPEWQRGVDLDLNISPTFVWVIHDLLPEEVSPKTALLPKFFARLAKMIAEGPKSETAADTFTLRILSVIVDEDKPLGVTVSLGVRFDEDGAAYATCSADWMEERRE